MKREEQRSGPGVRFTEDETRRAFEEWRFNCGPGALCAVLRMRPDELRPFLLDFEVKGYTNPTLMTGVLDGLGVRYRRVYRADQPGCALPKMEHGLIRVQWGGPWTREGVPMAARYRHTHWIAARKQSEEIFDINAMCVGGWVSFDRWAYDLVPWLMRECEPDGDGSWWPTHALEILGEGEVWSG